MTYQSPYGKREGLEQRLGVWQDRLGGKDLPWAGLGLIADLEAARRALTGEPDPAPKQVTDWDL